MPDVRVDADSRADRSYPCQPGARLAALRFSTRFVTAGFLEEDGEVWDGTGRLVGQSRQLALVPRN